MDAIQVEHLTKRYGDVLAVDDISFSVPPGRTIGLLGGNGAGKTTTIAMLLGLLIPTAGSIRVLGHDMARDRFAALARMNFSSPYVALPSRLSVAENLRVYGYLYGVRGLEARILELAAQLDLRELLPRPAGQLSAGQKTRVALAKALINRPDILLLDEPTASLDPDTGDMVRSWLERYRAESGCTILLASHNMGEVERLCDTVLMLKTGRDRRSGVADGVAGPLRAGRSGRGVPRHRTQPESGGMTPTAHLGADVPASGAVSPVLAARARAGVLAGAADVHLGVHRELPDGARRQRGGDGGERAARRGAAVGGGAAQPDGGGDQLPRGAVVAQSGPSLRQPDPALGNAGRAGRHLLPARADRRAAGDPAGLTCSTGSTCSRWGR